MRTSELRESVSFRRRADLPGIEIRDVENSARNWRCFSTGFEFLAPRSWTGEILYRRRRDTVAPGMIFCSHPGEVFSTPRVHQAGSGSALVIEPDVLHDYLSEHSPSPRRVELRRFTRMSNAMMARFSRLSRAMTSATTLLEVQSSVVSFLGVVMNELDEGPRGGAGLRAADRDPSAAERVRDRLHDDPEVDLDGLARQARLSRFQVLRAFKRRYGMPPHAYQLCTRIGMAQRALKAGQAPADVAAQFGFVDQSHLCRHFKRLVGITPGRYARAADSNPSAEVP